MKKPSTEKKPKPPRPAREPFLDTIVKKGARG